MLSPFIKSGLREAIETKFKDTLRIGINDVEGTLKGRGAPPAEIEASGIAELAQAMPGKSVTKQDLLALEEARMDTFGVEEGPGFFKHINLPRATSEPGKYYEDLTTWTRRGTERANASHWAQHEIAPEYLYHARGQNHAVINGRKSNLVYELQSDLHQGARNAEVDAAIEQAKSRARGADRDSYLGVAQLKRTIGKNTEITDYAEATKAELKKHGISAELWADMQARAKEYSKTIEVESGYKPPFTEEELEISGRLTAELERLAGLNDEAFDESNLDRAVFLQDIVGRHAKQAVTEAGISGDQLKGLAQAVRELAGLVNVRSYSQDGLDLANRLNEVNSIRFYAPKYPEDTPFRDNWLDKNLQQQLAKTYEQGDSQMVVVLKEYGSNKLVRGAGAQVMYDTKVPKKMQTLAKKIGGTYKEIDLVEDTTSGTKFSQVVNENLDAGLNVVINRLPVPPSIRYDLNNIRSSLGQANMEAFFRGYATVRGDREAVRAFASDMAEGFDRESGRAVEHLAKIMLDYDTPLAANRGTVFARSIRDSNGSAVSEVVDELDMPRADRSTAAGHAFYLQYYADRGVIESFLNRYVEAAGDPAAIRAAVTDIQDQVDITTGQRFSALAELLIKHDKPVPAEGEPVAKAGVIELPEKPNFSSFKLYSAAGISIPAVTQLLDENYQPEEIEDMAVELGADRGEIASVIDRIIKGRTDAARNMGYADNEIAEAMTAKGMSPTQIDRHIPKNSRPKDAPDTWTAKLTDYELLRLARFYRDAPATIDPASAEAKFGQLYKEMGLRNLSVHEAVNMPPVSPQEMQRLAQTVSSRNSSKPTVSDKDPILVTPYESVTQPQPEQTERLTPEQLKARVENVRFTYAGLLDQANVLLFGDPDARVRVETELKETTFAIVQSLNDSKIPAMLNSTGDIVIQDPATGEQRELTLDLWDSIVEGFVASKAEVGSAVMGGVAGGAAGGIAFGPWGAFIGGVLGGASAAALGRGTDVVRNALETKQDVDNQMLLARMKDAGVADGVLSLVTSAVLTAGGKVIGKSFDLLVQGNRAGAYTELKNTFLLTDDQIDELIKGWEKLNQKKAPGLTRATKALTIIPRIIPGSEALVRPAAILSSTASRTLAREIHERADSIMAAADSLSSDVAPQVIGEALPVYRQKVMEQFDGVKEFAIQEARDAPYRFDYDSLGLEPILARLEEKIADPRQLDAFEAYMMRLRKLGAFTNESVRSIIKQQQEQVTRPYARGGPKTSTVTRDVPVEVLVREEGNKLRTFENLLELRRAVNAFKPAKQLLGTSGYEALQEVVRRIDTEIAAGAEEVMPDTYEQWLKNWREVNVEYSKMKSLETNVLAKALTKKAATPQTVAKAMLKNISSLDSTFRSVIEVLPERQRNLVEGEVVKGLVEKYSAGVEGGKRAIHFPLLAQELASVPLTSAEAREFKRVIDEFANVFRNDVQLMQATGAIQVPRFQSYLASDPVVRLKFEIMSSTFNYVKRLMPTAKGRTTAMVTNVAKLLENPADAATFELVKKQLPAEVIQPLEQLQLELAKWGQKSIYPKVELYRQAPSGQSRAKTDGPLGNGTYYYTTPERAKEKGGAGKVYTKEVLPKTIANEDNIKQLMGMPELNWDELKNNPRFRNELWKRGYDGINLGDEVVIF